MVIVMKGKMLMKMVTLIPNDTAVAKRKIGNKG